VSGSRRTSARTPIFRACSIRSSQTEKHCRKPPREVKDAAEAAGMGAVAAPVLAGAGKVLGGVAKAFKNVPADVEEQLVSSIGNIAQKTGLIAPEVSTAKAAYSALDDEALGVQELKQKIADQSRAVKGTTNARPRKRRRESVRVLPKTNPNCRNCSTKIKSNVGLMPTQIGKNSKPSSESRARSCFDCSNRR